MSKKMTPWFPSSIKPVRSGVYQVFTPNNSANKYSYFDKKGWRLCSASIKEAKNIWSFEASLSSMYLARSKWRGFTKEQK